MEESAHRGTPDQITRGILLRIGSAISLSIMSALFKLASTFGFNAAEMVFYRSLFSLPVVLAWVLWRHDLAGLRPNRPVAHIWRSALGLASMFLTFQALILLPLAEATTINFSAPVFATVLSWLILREQVGPRRWTAVLIGFAGVIIIARPGSLALPLAGLAAALAAAAAQATVMITLRKLHGSENVESIVFWFAVAGLVAGACLLPFFAHRHDWVAVPIIAAGGLMGGITQLLMTASLRAPVSVVMPFDYLQIVGATLLGWVLFATVPTVYTFAGAALIAGSGLYTGWREHRLRRQVRREADIAVGDQVVVRPELL